MAINTSIPVNKSNYGHGHPPPPIAVNNARSPIAQLSVLYDKSLYATRYGSYIS